MSGREAAILPTSGVEGEVQQMVKVAIEVRSGTARFRVAVTSETIERALGLVERRFPGKRCRVSFPINPDAFFVRGPARAEKVDQPEKLAA